MEKLCKRAEKIFGKGAYMSSRKRVRCVVVNPSGGEKGSVEVTVSFRTSMIIINTIFFRIFMIIMSIILESSALNAIYMRERSVGLNT